MSWPCIVDNRAYSSKMVKYKFDNKYDNRVNQLVPRTDSDILDSTYHRQYLFKRVSLFALYLESEVQFRFKFSIELFFGNFSTKYFLVWFLFTIRTRDIEQNVNPKLHQQNYRHMVRAGVLDRIGRILIGSCHTL